MKVYLFSGSHLPEMATCLQCLAGACEDDVKVRSFLPRDFSCSTDMLPHELYDPLAPFPEIGLTSEATGFLVLDPRSPLPEQFEKLATVLAHAGMEPAKVITCIDMQAAEASEAYRQWSEASIYHSDLVLLGNRRDAGKAFTRKFQTGYEKACYPCRFLLLKGDGKPDKPLEVLAPDTRRLTQIFDLAEPEDLGGMVIEASFDLEADNLEDEAADTASSEMVLSFDSPVPDISDWVVLPESPPRPHP